MDPLKGVMGGKPPLLLFMSLLPLMVRLLPPPPLKPLHSFPGSLPAHNQA